MKYVSTTFQHIMEKSMIHTLSSIMSLGDRFHMSRKGGTGVTGGGGWVHPNVKQHQWRILVASNVFLCTITAQVHQMVMQQWHAATATRHSYTLKHQLLTDLQMFD